MVLAATKCGDGAASCRMASWPRIRAGSAARVTRAVRPRARRGAVAVATVSCVACLAGLGAAVPAAASASRGNGAAATCGGWTVEQPPNPGFNSSLKGVAVLSSSNAWAVGSFDPLDGDPTARLIEHWDGSEWTGQSGGRGTLTAVAASSRTNVWAVGYRFNAGPYRTVIEHWDGTAWRQLLPSPEGLLYGVTAISSTNVWAVGSVIMHWNGIAWKKVPIPIPGGVLLAVAASSRTNVWAVGGYSRGTLTKTLVLHWNGTKWRHVPSPSPAGTSTGNLNILDSVTIISRDNVWAAGYDTPVYSSPRNTLIEHWNGTRWKHATSPNPGGPNGSLFAGVAAASESNVWAVGDYSDGTATRTLIARWNGTAWKQVASPNPAGTSAFAINRLNAVAAVSATNVWAVGSWSGMPGGGTLAIHHC